MQNFKYNYSMESLKCCSHSQKNDIKSFKEKWYMDSECQFNSPIFNLQMCHTPQIESKDGLSEDAHLSQERCTEAAPFTYRGVDMFGPFINKERRSNVKHYVALLNFFSIRVVHIEVTNSLDADSFILALRRFMSRRRLVRSIWSDNDSNFVVSNSVANSELKRALKEMKHEKIKTFL